MPYKYVKETSAILESERLEKERNKPKVTETKELSKPKPITEEEYQIETVEQNQKKFFDEDDEIIEVNWD